LAYDLFFLSHGEPMAEWHWRNLLRTQPHARRVDGIDGILAAHRQCASLARTTNFFVVDADNEILDCDFHLRLADHDKQYVHIWRARNPVNGLVYGWGGIKLFPRKLLLGVEQMPLDMTTSFPLKIVDVIGSVTHFNSSPFSTWRSAFRECVKLARNSDPDSRARLDVWCSTAHNLYADWCLTGASAGRHYGMTQTDPAALLRINDWPWLHEQFARDHENH
jgi:hypothetical protein